MAGESTPRPAPSASPSATGTLAATPLAHALVYVRSKKLTGAFDLRAPDGRAAQIAFWRGLVIGVRVDPVATYLSEVLEGLGYVERSLLLSTLGAARAERKRHGEVLVERGIISRNQRDEALIEQMRRRIHALFRLPAESTYAFYDAVPGEKEPRLSVDVLAAVWRGIHEIPPIDSVKDVLRRIGTSPLRMINENAVEAARLPRAELALCARLTTSTMTLAELRAATELPAARVELLVYLLVIAKCIEPSSGARATPSTGALPAASVSSGSLPVAKKISGVRAPGSSQDMPAVSVPSPPTSSRTMPAAAVAPSGPADLGAAGIAYLAQTIETEDPFRILGIPHGVSTEAVRAAFIRLARLWHPDRLPSELAPFRAEAEKIFAYMSRAHETLCSPAARAILEKKRASAPPPPRERKDIMRELEHALGKREFAFAEEEAKRLVDRDADDGEAQAIAAWAAAHAGDASEEVLRASLARLDKAVAADRTCERSFYYRGMIAKRLGNPQNAMRDFARAVQLNPKHVDAQRELRVFEMRARKSGELKLGDVLSKITGKK